VSMARSNVYGDLRAKSEGIEGLFDGEQAFD